VRVFADLPAIKQESFWGWLFFCVADIIKQLFTSISANDFSMPKFSDLDIFVITKQLIF